ncbi:Endothelin-converting enzyme [Blattella germanica]|nr:Endothelin-converting enzyme [Blattella germanica]
MGKPAAHDPKPIQLTYKLYELCLDTDKIEKMGLEPLIQALDTLGLSTSLPTSRINFDWLRAIAMIRKKLGISLLVGFQVKPDYNRSRYDMFIIIPAEKKKDPYEMNVYSLQNLMEASGRKLNPELNWTRYLEYVMKDSSVKLNFNMDLLMVKHIEYLQKLGALISNTDPVIIEMSKVPPLFLNSRPIAEPKLKDIQKLNQFVPPVYHTSYDSSTSKAALEMTKNIRSAFEETIPELDWMNEQTRTTILGKASAIQMIIGFPDWILKLDELDKYYKETEVMDGQWFETYVDFLEKTCKTELEVLRKKPDISRSLNYGAIGSVMGHEIVHGINENAAERMRCFVSQYNKFHFSQLGDNLTVNGTRTQYENIADNGGLRKALRAYQKCHATNEHQLTLPELAEYSPEQLFFLSFANIWCGQFRDDKLRHDVQSSPYSPHKFRVLGSLLNLNEFSESWSCPPGSPMNPSNKCILW